MSLICSINSMLNACVFSHRCRFEKFVELLWKVLKQELWNRIDELGA